MKRIEYLQAVIESQKSSIEVFMEIQKTPDSLMIVDVREGDSSFLKDKIQGDLEMPLSEFESRLNELPKDKLIYLTTWNSTCTLAKRASVSLLKAGYQTFEIAGGNEAWKNTNLPIEKISTLEVSN